MAKFQIPATILTKYRQYKKGHLLVVLLSELLQSRKADCRGMLYGRIRDNKAYFTMTDITVSAICTIMRSLRDAGWTRLLKD